MKNFERLKYLWVVVIFFVGLAAYEFIGYSQYKKSETPPPPTIFVGKSAENGDSSRMHYDVKPTITPGYGLYQQVYHRKQTDDGNHDTDQNKDPVSGFCRF